MNKNESSLKDNFMLQIRASPTLHSSTARGGNELRPRKSSRLYRSRVVGKYPLCGRSWPRIVNSWTTTSHLLPGTFWQQNRLVGAPSSSLAANLRARPWLPGKDACWAITVTAARWPGRMSIATSLPWFWRGEEVKGFLWKTLKC